MKKSYFLVSALLLTAATSYGQGTELFFSEYDEGAHQSGVSYNGGVSNSTGSERAIEVYNPTTATVNLNAYSIRRYSNGSATPTEEERLFRSNASQTATGANTLLSQSTFVIASNEATLPVIRNAANQFSVGHAPVSGPTVITGGGTVYFNGDDAMALVRYPSGTAGTGTGVIVDIFGIIGYQPLPASGTGTGQFSGTNPADGTPAVYVASANQSLLRRPTVSAGTKVNPTVGSYNIADQWSVYSYAFPPGTTGNTEVGNQSYSRLGEHLDYTGPFGAYTTLKTLDKFNSAISVYPNPASGSATVEIKGAKVGSIAVLNNLGQTIVAQPRGLAQETITLDISRLKTGLYFVQFISQDGQMKVYKELMVK